MNSLKLVDIFFKAVCVALLVAICCILWKTYEQSKIIKRQNDDLWRQARQTQVKLSLKDGIFRNGDIKFYVPNYPMDGIQRYIVDSGKFFEEKLLEQIDDILPDNPVILDIGANIGNHTLYWLLKSPKKAKHVYSFEVIDETYNVLKNNIEINKLQNKATAYNFGLSNVNSRATVKKSYQRSTSMNSETAILEEGENGAYRFKKLDSLQIPDKVDFIKVDVEGQEMQVMKGAVKFLAKHKPTIWVEVWPDWYYIKNNPEKKGCKHREEFNDFMDKLGYKMVKHLGGSDFIYKHRSKIAD